LGLATARAFADVVVVFGRQHIVALMRPIAFAAAQLNVVLHDASVSPIPAISIFARAAARRNQLFSRAARAR
jgi:hypothetical protein